MTHDKEKAIQTMEIANISRDILENSSFYDFINFYKENIIKSNGISIAELSKMELSFTKQKQSNF